MKALLKVAIPLALVFAATFVVAKLLGVLSIEQVKDWFDALRDLPSYIVGSVVAVLLFADLFIAIPNLTVTMLAGYFLGFVQGSLYALIGAMMSGIVGYFISRRFGGSVLEFLLKNESERNQLVGTFKAHGFLMIICSRAVPILPEVTACLAGMTKMSFRRFLAAWSVSSVPYTLIATYSGSLSSLEDPKPALYTALAMTCGLWLIWFIYNRWVGKKVQPV